MLELEEALSRILTRMPAPRREVVPLANALGRVALDPIAAPISLPPFDNSAMDGYAVRAADVTNVSQENPRSLRLIGRTAAGEVFGGEVAAGTCVRVFTGSPLPRGADAVVMQEDTRTDAGAPGAVAFLDSAKPWENVRFAGEDVKAGTAVANPGERISAGRASLLAALGISTVAVARQPQVALLATGSELREAGQPLAPGQIFESNRLGLGAFVAQAGGRPQRFPLVSDTLAGTRAALAEAFAQSDVVVTSGGVSVGEFDFVKDAFTALGGELNFWKVAIRPGKPFVFGQLGEKFLFGVPGNPVSALVTFFLLVRPALLRWQGARDLAPPTHPGTLTEPLVNRGDRRHFIRVAVDPTGSVRPSGVQASHFLSSLADAHGLVDVPPATTLAAGQPVRVLRWDI
ncbi:molybdopterin molybdenumtransferase MoeA [Verrucomicrobiota bacterium]|nr:molybdopterin molybdenumtransferase MoeA [Verrucomicrobiota bacterium]